MQAQIKKKIADPDGNRITFQTSFETTTKVQTRFKIQKKSHRDMVAAIAEIHCK